MEKEQEWTAMDVLANAISIIAESHGMAITNVRVEWTRCQETGKQFPVMILNDLEIQAKPCQRR